VPTFRVETCAEACLARRDTCYEECTRAPDEAFCEPRCRDELRGCMSLCP